MGTWADVSILAVDQSRLNILTLDLERLPIIKDLDALKSKCLLPDDNGRKVLDQIILSPTGKITVDANILPDVLDQITDCEALELSIRTWENLCFDLRVNIQERRLNLEVIRDVLEGREHMTKKVILQAPTTDANNPLAAGCIASEKILFGPHNRYAVYAVHTRFKEVEWFVYDAEKPDNSYAGGGSPSVIRQCATFEEAIKDLEVETS